MKIDIIFISYNRKNDVIFNLDKMSKYKSINKIIWADNGSSDGTEMLDTSNYGNVESIKLKENIGIAAYNRAVEHSDSDIIIVLDDDSHIEEDAIGNVEKYFTADKQLGALAFDIILPSTGETVTNDWKPGNTTTFWGCGAAVRTSVWKKLGGYREELFLYTNEFDLSIRIWNAGYKVRYTDEIKAYHRVSTMNRTSDRLISYSLKNDYIFANTYFDAKYRSSLIRRDRFVWFIRAFLSGSLSAYFEGVKKAKETIVRPNVVDKKIQKFYIKHHRNFEPIFDKIFRKIKYKKFKVRGNV